MIKVYDALAKERGLLTVGDQAKFHGAGRPHWSAIRNGRKSPSAALALKVAEQFEVEPQALWRRERVAA